jgi:serine/threonine protein kinase
MLPPPTLMAYLCSKDGVSFHAMQQPGVLSQAVTTAAMQGLDVIHGCGLVHGDIKPNNFRLAMKPDGSQVHLVITDLGNCCAAGSGEP